MRVLSLLVLLLLIALPSGALRAQDPAVEEKLNKITGQVEDLLAALNAQEKRIEGLANEIRDLRQQIEKPNPDYATQQDLKQLAETVREVDQKRLNDYEKIRSELENLGKLLSASIAGSVSPTATNSVPQTTNVDQVSIPPGTYFEYVVQTNDALSRIAQSYRREKNIKVTVEDILKANPSLSPNRIRAGQKIIIPATSQP